MTAEKIATLHAEIVQLQELNEHIDVNSDPTRKPNFAHVERHERLQEIRQELTQIARLDGRLLVRFLA